MNETPTGMGVFVCRPFRLPFGFPDAGPYNESDYLEALMDWKKLHAKVKYFFWILLFVFLSLFASLVMFFSK